MLLVLHQQCHLWLTGCEGKLQKLKLFWRMMISMKTEKAFTSGCYFTVISEARSLFFVLRNDIFDNFIC